MDDKSIIATDYFFEMSLPLWEDALLNDKSWCETNGHTPEQYQDKVVYCESCGKTLELLK